MSRVLTEQRDKFLADFINSIKSTIEVTHEYVYPNQKEIAFNEVKALTKELCDIDQEFTLSNEALSQTITYFNDENNDSTQDVQDFYKKTYADLQGATQTTFYKSNIIWKTIDECINKNQENSEESEVEIDSSIICSASFNVPTDPLSKKPIKNACRNKICKHIYEYDTIISYINKKKSKVLCPYVGCTNNSLKVQDIQLDEELSQTIASTPVDDWINGTIVEV